MMQILASINFVAALSVATALILASANRQGEVEGGVEGDVELH